MSNLTEAEARANPESIVLQKNSREELRLSIDEYHGHLFASFRVWYLDDDSGEMRPSRKGLTVAPARWSAFRGGIEKLERQMMEQGFLP